MNPISPGKDWIGKLYGGVGARRRTVSRTRESRFGVANRPCAGLLGRLIASQCRTKECRGHQSVDSATRRIQFAAGIALRDCLLATKLLHPLPACNSLVTSVSTQNSPLSSFLCGPPNWSSFDFIGEILRARLHVISVYNSVN